MWLTLSQSPIPCLYSPESFAGKLQIKQSSIKTAEEAKMAAAMISTTTTATLPQFSGLRTQTSLSAVNNSLVPMRRRGGGRGSGGGGGALGARMDFIGSPTNVIMVTATSLMLFAGRFGLAPSANRKATAGLKLEARDSGLQTGDPAGFTLADTLACGSFGHIIGVGVVLGLKNIGAL